jgi:hypothetical protein
MAVLNSKVKFFRTWESVLERGRSQRILGGAAERVPTILSALRQLVGYERPSRGAKLAYLTLNTEQPNAFGLC